MNAIQLTISNPSRGLGLHQAPTSRQIIRKCAAFTSCQRSQLPVRKQAFAMKPREKPLISTIKMKFLFSPHDIPNFRLYSSQINSNQEKEVVSSDTTLEVDNEEYNVDHNNWRSHPSLSESIRIPTVFVKNDALHSLIKELNPYLAIKMKEFEDVHPRLKAIQNPETSMTSHLKIDQNIVDNMKIILLDPNRVHDTILFDENIEETISLVSDLSKEERIELLSMKFSKVDKTIIELLAETSAIPGPIISRIIPYQQQSISRILSKLLPSGAQPPPTGFEQIGHVIHLNLKEKHMPYKKLIGSVLLDRLSPKIQSVVNKVGEVSGPYRTYDMELLAGKPETKVEVVEDGISLNFDLRKVYWCTRLSGERSRVLSEEFKEGQIIADAFCGVGALCVLAATKLGCTIYANDLNPDAVKYFKESIKKNKKRINSWKKMEKDSKGSSHSPSMNVQCGDAFDFIQNLSSLSVLPHHVVMNYPLDSASFLGAFRWWPASDEQMTNNPTTVHLYTFARGDDPVSEVGNGKSNPRSAADVAIDLVADGLIPEGGAIERCRFRKAYLDKLGCEVKAYEVRDVAPGKVVICVSFKITPLLLSVMQGDYIDA
jgi:tRNA (guanine37-N1)-methyltransferase